MENHDGMREKRSSKQTHIPEEQALLVTSPKCLESRHPLLERRDYMPTKMKEEKLEVKQKHRNENKGEGLRCKQEP